jgi:hypothetical protein
MATNARDGARPFAEGWTGRLRATLLRPFHRGAATQASRARRFEFVCPFHRGDVLLAIQVAHTVHALGLDVRLHTSAALSPWVEAFDCSFPVRYLSTPIVGAAQAGTAVERALREVAALNDASPRQVRFHPKESLRSSGTHLLDAVLAQFGFRGRPPLLFGLRPRLEAADVSWARQELSRWGTPVVLLHSRGGWSLKSLRRDVGEDVRRVTARHGASLVQIGGPDDPIEPFCDGAICADLTLSRWRALFESAQAIFSVDSWTAHFATILDRPQAVFYGPTDPRLVHSRDHFDGRRSSCVVVRSSVPCSPCESLSCVAFPGASHCAGYGLGPATALERLLADNRPSS